MDRVAAALAAHELVLSETAAREWRWDCACGEWGRAIGPEPSRGARKAHRTHLAQILLAPGGVVAGMVAERVEALAPDVCKRLCDMDGNPRLFVSGEVRAVLRAALAAEPAENDPVRRSDGLEGSGVGGGGGEHE
jgi:hypothetical protein